ncbi:MAG: phosphate ABC transporter permease subunit PstC [Candidatus Riflebacteria bacterium]|nr:phosphate ABC transporter permease subunit PstC [Candidatus Riflebacteria bacterium]
MTNLQRNEKRVKRLLLVIAMSSVSILGLIILFVFKEGIPIIFKVGLKNFLTGTTWAPTKGTVTSFGILPMIIGTIQVTFGALLLGMPLSILVAIHLSEYASPTMRSIMKPTIELLAAIPSVVYGFIGVVVIVPFIREWFGGPGFSVLTASIILGIMILPTVISITYESIRAVPDSYREGALALGATKWQTITRVVLPAARSGIVTAMILGMGRAMGETMAVIMVAGNSVVIPLSPLHPCRTLTANIAIEMAYASGDHQKALFATGVVLFIMIFILNSVAGMIIKRK